MSNVKNIVMLGFGDMGKGIAQVCLMAGYNVIAVDVNDQIIEKSLDYIKTGFEKLEEKGKLPEGLGAADYIAKLKTSSHAVFASFLIFNMLALVSYHHIPATGFDGCVAPLKLLCNDFSIA